jgi:hypothetical protein
MGRREKPPTHLMEYFDFDTASLPSSKANTFRPTITDVPDTEPNCVGIPLPTDCEFELFNVVDPTDNIDGLTGEMRGSHRRMPIRL